MEQIVVITGASRGIGRMTAELFASRNAQVIAGYLHTPMPPQERILPVQADVTKREEVRTLIQTAYDRYGRIDVLVNNAGIAESKVFSDITEADWERMLATHLTGTFHACQEVLPYMLRQKRGSIINVASVWGECGAACEVHYSAAKAGVIGLTKALAKELAPSGIRVNAVSPGVIETDMLSAYTDEDKEALKQEIPIGRLGTPMDVAQAVWYLANYESGYVTGQVFPVNGGFYI